MIFTADKNFTGKIYQRHAFQNFILNESVPNFLDSVESALANSENDEKLKYSLVLFPRRCAMFSGLSDQIFLGKALFFVGRGDAIPSGRRLTPD